MLNITRKNRLIIGVVLVAALALAVLASYRLFSPTNPTEELDEKFRNWILIIDGLVDRPLNLSISNLLSMPST